MDKTSWAFIIEHPSFIYIYIYVSIHSVLFVGCNLIPPPKPLQFGNYKRTVYYILIKSTLY